jgi:predicted dehydrogenase
MTPHLHLANCASPLRSIGLRRRSFLKAGTALLGAGLASRFTPSVWAQPMGANGDVRVAVIGLNQKGALLTRQVLALSGVRLAALCDVDPRILAREVKALEARQISVFATTDARQLMSRADIDAVVIATSDHWHALLTLWACQAGKDVYVEKPVCHTVWEGEQMLAAAAKYGRIVQAGTQARSDPGVAEAVAAIRGGELGRIKWIHALCYRLREGIGRKLPWYPEWLDYDLYCGPAPMAPLERRDLHYDWHWNWQTGGGDLANIGVHQFDIARWFAGNPACPPKVLSLGGRFAVVDAGETPNTQLALYAYPEIPILFEIRGRPAKPGVKSMDQTRGIREGVIVQCEHGYYAGFVGGALFDHTGRRLKTIKGDGGGAHMANFIAAVRSRRSADLAAPLAIGRDSSVGCLLGNISYRLGAPANLAEAQREIADFPAAPEVLKNLQVHLAAHSVDLAQTPLTLGRWLELDRATADIVGVTGAEPPALARAQFLRKGSHRPPYTIPTVT